MFTSLQISTKFMYVINYNLVSQAISPLHEEEKYWSIFENVSIFFFLLYVNYCTTRGVLASTRREEKEKSEIYIIHNVLTPFSLDGRRQTVFSFSDLFLATRIFVVLWPLSRPTANSYLGAILPANATSRYLRGLIDKNYRCIQRHRWTTIVYRWT